MILIKKIERNLPYRNSSILLGQQILFGQQIHFKMLDRKQRATYQIKKSFAE